MDQGHNMTYDTSQAKGSQYWELNPALGGVTIPPL